MAKQAMVFSLDEAREIPGFGVYQPGQEVKYNEILMATGLFKLKNEKGDDK